MAAPKFELKGFKELIHTLKHLGGPKFARKANRRAVNLATQIILDAARSNCPSDKGDLKAAMIKKITNRGYHANGIVGADAEYVSENGDKPSHYDHLVEYGHQTPEGKTIPPHPYLRPAWDESIAAAQAKYAEVLAEEIEKAAKQGGK